MTYADALNEAMRDEFMDRPLTTELQAREIEQLKRDRDQMVELRLSRLPDGGKR